MCVCVCVCVEREGERQRLSVLEIRIACVAAIGAKKKKKKKITGDVICRLDSLKTGKACFPPSLIPGHAACVLLFTEMMRGLCCVFVVEAGVSGWY